MPRIWTKDFTIITFVNSLLALNFYLLMIVIPLFSMESFGSTPSEAGLAASIFVLGALAARPFSGRWIERVGRKRFLCAGAALWVVANLGYFPANGIAALLLVRFLNGVAFGMISTSTATAIGSIVPAQRRGEGMGYYMLGATIATAIGPFMSIMISRTWGFNSIFVLCGVLSVLSLASVLAVSIPEVKLTSAELAEMKGLKLSNFVERKVVPIAIICAIFNFCYVAIVSFLAAFAEELQMVNAAGLFFVVVAIVLFVSRPLAGRLFDLRGENIVMYPGLLVYAVGLITLSQAHLEVTMLGAAALIGLGHGVIHTSGQSITVKLSSPQRLGLANSTYYTFFDAGAGLGPFLLGFLIPAYGYRGLYVCTGSIMLVCVLLYYVLHGRHAVAPEVISHEGSRSASPR